MFVIVMQWRHVPNLFKSMEKWWSFLKISHLSFPWYHMVRRWMWKEYITGLLQVQMLEDPCCLHKIILVGLSPSSLSSCLDGRKNIKATSCLIFSLADHASCWLLGTTGSSRVRSSTKQPNGTKCSTGRDSYRHVVKWEWLLRMMYGSLPWNGWLNGSKSLWWCAKFFLSLNSCLR